MLTDIPSTRITWRDGHNWVHIVGYRAGTKEQVSIEMTLDEFVALPAVQYAAELLAEGTGRGQNPGD
jgi:hypothetical protein